MTWRGPLQPQRFRADQGSRGARPPHEAPQNCPCKATNTVTTEARPGHEWGSADGQREVTAPRPHSHDVTPPAGTHVVEAETPTRAGPGGALPTRQRPPRPPHCVHQPGSPSLSITGGLFSGYQLLSALASAFLGPQRAPSRPARVLFARAHHPGLSHAAAPQVAEG